VPTQPHLHTDQPGNGPQGSQDILVERSRELSVEDIIKKVSVHFNIKVTDLKSPKRLKAVVLPRQVAMYLARQLTSSSYPEIGERFGGKDHPPSSMRFAR